jgi:hypothetical protein
VSINIDLEEKTESKGDFDMVDLMPQMQLNVREAAIYDNLTVETSNKNDLLWVFTGKHRYPSVWFFLCIFGPVLLFAALTPAPYAAFIAHYKHIETWPVSTCATTSVEYNPNALYLHIQATYVDTSQVRHSAEFYYDMGYDLDVDNYLLDFFQLQLSYPCYYNEGTFYETGFPSYEISYAKRFSRRLTGGLVGSWLAILILTCLGFFIPWCLGYDRRAISKEVFEKTGETVLEVQDWGGVDGALKQILYSVIYNSCVQQNVNAQGEQIKKGIRFIAFTRRSAASLLSLAIFGANAFVFVATIAVMLGFACAERQHVFMITLLWSMASIIVIIPAGLLFLIFFTILHHPYVNATAVVNCISPGVFEAPETVNIFGKFYSDMKLGYVLKGTVRRA